MYLPTIRGVKITLAIGCSSWNQSLNSSSRKNEVYKQLSLRLLDHCPSWQPRSVGGALIASYVRSQLHSSIVFCLESMPSWPQRLV